MASLLQSELENAQERYNTLAKQGRRDTIAHIVLARLEQEIHNIKRSIKHEEKPRQEIDTRTSSSRFTRYFKQVVDRYRPKLNGNHHTIPSIPAIDTL